nr:GrBNV_gp17-like protein [Oryctes rhinoceros nudivirus]
MYKINNSLNGVAKRKNCASSNHDELVANTYKRIKSEFYMTNGVNGGEISLRAIKPFVAFDHKSSYGIPRRLELLADVDIQNLETPLAKYTKVHRDDVNIVDYCHLQQYLSAKEFDRRLLYDTTYDCVVNAIVSYVLDWPDDKLAEFVSLYPQYDRLCAEIKAFRALDDGAYVYDYRGIPVVRTAIKIIKFHFEAKRDGRQMFDWMSLLDFDFVNHLHDVYNWVLNDELDAKKIALLESDMDIPYALPNIDVSTLKQYDREYVFKFITGEACCCKTTIIDKLTELGWKKYSRGDIGSFSGKSNNPAAIGNLHAALHFVLTQPDVIGDRGFIDNVIWSFIMPGCNPQNKSTYIRDLFSFLNSNFNEPSIAEYITQKGVIFIDPKSKKNQERQLRRCEDGDPWRARLKLYTVSQFMTYYAVARLFGWKVICVPYTEDGEIDACRYQANIDAIIRYFGSPKRTGKPYVRFSKPSNFYVIDTVYPKSVGIFK